jgi:hypothetical protein
MKATEARAAALTVNQAEFEKELKMVHNKIKEDVHDGKFVTSIYGTLRFDTLDSLRDDGYTVIPCADGPNEQKTIIKW